MPRSLLFATSEELSSPSTPTTWSCTPSYVTVRPTAFCDGKSSLAVSEPSTTTRAAVDSSLALMNRPDDNFRERTVCHDEVVPVRVVVQFVEPFSSSADVVDTGATAEMSGAAVFDAERGRVALRERRRGTEAATRARGARLTARRHHEHVRAELIDLVAHLGLGARTKADGKHDRGDADEDAECGEHRTEPVAAHRAECRSYQVVCAHDAPPLPIDETASTPSSS